MADRQLPLFRSHDDLVVDLFAGAGGASVGIEAALRRPVDVALNHDGTALAVHRANHPQTVHMEADVWDAKPRDVTRGRRVSLLWMSPDCRHFSNAKGAAPRSESVRSLADAGVRWARDVRPDVICLENVQEFLSWGPLGNDNRPIKARAGEEFRRWHRDLERAGYAIEHRILDASHYGAPTRRRRLFVIARSDGRPIVWPEPTHGLGLEPFHTAAECIDWSLPCPSIFERRKPLAEKTLWRIAEGLRRFVFESNNPFLLHLDESGRFVLPTLQQSGYGERPGQAARVPGLHAPIGTLVNGQKHALVQAFAVKHFGDPRRKSGGGRVAGAELDRPLSTVTGRDHQSLAAVALAKFRGTSSGHPGTADLLEPLPTISSGGGRGGGHVAEVRAFLTAYYGQDGSFGQSLHDPARTLTTRARLGLVVIAGDVYQITDIGLRMLQPHELLRAQFGRFAGAYDLSAARTKAAKIRLIGNSVCPEIAEAIVAANFGMERARAA